MNRRGFMGSILALGVAPAIVRADSLMRIVPRDMASIGELFQWTDIWVEIPFHVTNVAKHSTDRVVLTREMDESGFRCLYEVEAPDGQDTRIEAVHFKKWWKSPQ